MDILTRYGQLSAFAEGKEDDDEDEEEYGQDEDFAEEQKYDDDDEEDYEEDRDHRHARR